MTKRFIKRLDSNNQPITIEGISEIPLNPDGSVVYGIYTIWYVYDYGGVEVRLPRTLKFLNTDHSIEWRLNGNIITNLDGIDVFAIGSSDPFFATKFVTVDTSVGDLQAWYHHKDLNGATIEETNITSLITTDDTSPQGALISNELPEGYYPVNYNVTYTNAQGTFVDRITKIIKSTKRIAATEEYYDFRWEPENLSPINKNIGDVFPTVEEMSDIIPIPIITDKDTGEEVRLNTVIVYPSYPNPLQKSTVFTAKFSADNRLSGSLGDSGITQQDFDTYVVPRTVLRKIVYNLPTSVPLSHPVTPITFDISNLTPITYQDYLSGSTPVPIYYANGGLMPTEAQLLNGVTATYVDQNGATQNLSVSVTRPIKRAGILDAYFTGDEVNMHIPRTWKVPYTATSPDGTIKTAYRDIVIEDTIPPQFNKQFPTTVEKGTLYEDWSDQFSSVLYYGLDYPKPHRQFVAPRCAVQWSIDITPEQFESLDDGDTFVATATTTDEAGNSASVSQTIACQDTVSPLLNFADLLRYPLGSDPSDAQLKIGTTVSDVSEPTTLTVDDSAVDYNGVGIYVATYTAKDTHDNTRVKTRTVIVYDPAAVSFPPAPGAGSPPTACPATAGVPNIFIAPATNISVYTDADWIVGLNAAQGDEDVSYKIVVDAITTSYVPKKPNGTIEYDPDSNGITNNGVTPYFINYEIQTPDGIPLICTSRLIEVQDTQAPVINNVPNPLTLSISGSGLTPSAALTQLKTLVDVVDNIDGTSYTIAILEGLTQQEINTGADVVKTLRFIDSSSNESRAQNITIKFAIVDADGDGILDARDQFPSDALFATDIDADGTGDDDTIVLWHHDFNNTLSYLEVREAEINSSLTLNGEATSPAFGTRMSNGIQKDGVEIANNNFHIQTSNVDASPVGLSNTSLNFAMALETITPSGGFSLDNSDEGRFIYFQAEGNTDATKGRMEIKIKKLQQISTGNTVYRFSVYTIREGAYIGAGDNGVTIFNNSKYSNPTNSTALYYNLTDLADYNVLNDIGVGELYGDNATGYSIEHYMTNTDLPLDSQLHAYSFCFQPRSDGASGYEIAYCVDGELKQILTKEVETDFGLTTPAVSYNLHGFSSMFMSDYIWTTHTDIDKIVAIQNKMLSSSFSVPSLYGDTDGDGLSDIQEDLLGSQFDKTNPNTDASLIQNHTDTTDDYVERWISKFATPLSSATVIGGVSFTEQASSSEDFTQTDFVNHFNNGIKFSSGIAVGEMTLAFWWINDGNLPSSVKILSSDAAQDYPALAWDDSGQFYTKNYGSSTNGAGTATGFSTTYNNLFASEGLQWKHFAATFNSTTGEIKIYINSVLFDTVSNYTGGASSRINWSSSMKWTDFAQWTATLEQSKITQIYNRGKDLEYDLRNEYPIIVTDNDPIITGFTTTNVSSDYTELLLTDSLVYTTNADQLPKITTVNNYQLASAISNSASVAGIYDIVIETTSAQGIKTYTTRQVLVSEPLRGFMEELPWMPSPAGSYVNMSHLEFDTSMPAGDSNEPENNPIVRIPGSTYSGITDEYSLSFWWNRSALTGVNGTFFKSNDSGASPYINLTMIGTNGAFQILSGFRSTVFEVGYNTFFSSTNTWNHVVVTTSNVGNQQTLKVYQNGSLYSQGTTTYTKVNAALDWSGDVKINSLRNMNIDSFEIVDYPLADIGVANLYAAGRQVFMSEVSHSNPPVITLTGDDPLTITTLPISIADDPGATATDVEDGNISASVTSDWDSILGTNPANNSYTITYSVTDSAGLTTNSTRTVVVNVEIIEEKTIYDGIEDLGTTTLYNDAVLNGGILNLDGTGYAIANSKHWYADHFHVSAWFKTNQAGTMVLVESRKWAPGYNGFTVAMDDNAILTHHPQNNNRLDYTLQAGEDMKDNQWHKIELKWIANTELSIYLDGQKKISSVPSGGIAEANVNVHIGVSAHDYTLNFVGQIDSVLVENVIKTDAEILAEYQTQDTKNPSITLIGANPFGMIDLSTSDPGATAIDHPDGDLTAQIISDWNSVIGANPAFGNYTVTYTITDSDGNVSNATRSVIVGEGLEDISTLQNGATLSNGTLVLDGVDDYAALPNSTDYDLDGGDMTVHCWFKTDSATGAGRGLMTKGIGNPIWKGWGLYLHDANGIAFNFWSSNVGGGNRSNLFGSASDWSVGGWNHIAVVMSTANPYKAYVNGQLLHEFTPNSKSTTTSAELKIGATQIHNNNNLGHPFGGEIKKANIVKSALSATDILAIYNAG